MRERLRRVLRFITPSTAVGFLGYGWIGGVLAAAISHAFPGILGTVSVLMFYVPLWILATRARSKQIEIAKFVHDVQKKVEAIEEDDRTESDTDEG